MAASMVSRKERRAQSVMRTVTGFGGLLSITLLMAAFPGNGAAQLPAAIIQSVSAALI